MSTGGQRNAGEIVEKIEGENKMSELVLKQNIFFLLFKKILACMEEVIMQFSEIYPKYERFIDSGLSKYPGLAEFDDMKQDILLTIAKKCQGILNPQKIKSWLFTTIKNYAIDKMRAKKRKSRVINFSEIEADSGLLEYFEQENTLVDYKDPATLIENKELKDKIKKTINKLADPWKRVLIARHFENLSYEEIAKKYDINLGTVKSRIARAREKFVKKFQEKE